MFLEALFNSLWSLCEEKGLTYKDVSLLCHSSTQYFGRIIRCESVPSIAILENICHGLGKTPNGLLRVSNDMEEVSYRTPMRVKAVCGYQQGLRVNVFPVCPRCNASMEWEFQALCDRCGHQLSWKGFRSAAFRMAQPDTGKSSPVRSTECTFLTTEKP